jgi:hypothetical protein
MSAREARDLVQNPDALSLRETSHLRADGRDVARELEPQRPGQRDRPARDVLAQVDIEMVEGARAHTDEDVVVTRDRVGDVVEAEHVAPAVLVEANCLHSV